MNKIQTIYHGGTMIMIRLFMPLSSMLQWQLQMRMKFTVLWLLLLVGAEAVAVLIDAYVERL